MNPRYSQKQVGVTPAERHLHALAERTFLSLWSYPCVHRDQGVGGGRQGKEVCDLLVIFGEDVLIFSDKDCEFPNSGDLRKDWNRWFRRAIASSADQIFGAERWLRRFPERVFLDRECSVKLPVALPPPTTMRVHRIVVAHASLRRAEDYFGGGSRG